MHFWVRSCTTAIQTVLTTLICWCFCRYNVNHIHYCILLYWRQTFATLALNTKYNWGWENVIVYYYDQIPADLISLDLQVFGHELKYWHWYHKKSGNHWVATVHPEGNMWATLTQICQIVFYLKPQKSPLVVALDKKFRDHQSHSFMLAWMSVGNFMTSTQSVLSWVLSLYQNIGLTDPEPQCWCG